MQPDASPVSTCAGLTWQNLRQLILPEEASRHHQRQNQEEGQTQLGPPHLHPVGFGESLEFGGGDGGGGGGHSRGLLERQTDRHMPHKQATTRGGSAAERAKSVGQTHTSEKSPISTPSDQTRSPSMLSVDIGSKRGSRKSPSSCSPYGRSLLHLTVLTT